MYKESTKITINTDYYNKKLCYKCVAGTNLSRSLLPDTIGTGLIQLGNKLITAKLQEINVNYSVFITSIKFGTWKKYKFKGDEITEYSCTVTFRIKFRGELLSEILEQGAMDRLINNNGGSNVFIFE